MSSGTLNLSRVEVEALSCPWDQLNLKKPFTDEICSTFFHGSITGTLTLGR
jgi:hypothetical protein